MARKRIMASLSAVVLATMGCLFLAALVPMLFGGGISPSSVTSSGVQASPRDLYAIEQPLRLADAPNLLLLSGRLFSDPQASPKGQTKLVLDHPVLELETSGPAAASGERRSALTAASSDIVAVLLERLVSGGYDTLEVRKGTAVLKSAGVVAETLTDISTTLTLPRRNNLVAQGAFTVGGLRMEFDGSVGLTGDKTGAKGVPMPVRLTLRSAAVQATLDGKLDVSGPLALAGQIDASIPRLWQFARWLGIAAPETTALKDIAIKSQLNWAKGVMSFDKAAVALDGQQATGALSLNYRGGRPALEGTLAFASFDVAPYLQTMMPDNGPIDALAAAWPAIETRLPLVLHADADLRVSTPKLQLAGAQLGRGAATLSTRSGLLHADIAELEIIGVKSTMQVSADMNGAYPRYGVRGRLELANAGSLLAGLIDRELLEGRAVAQIDVTGTGDTFGQLLRSATGKGGLAATQGVRMAGDLKALGPFARDFAKPPQREPGWGPIAKGQSALDAFDFKFDIGNGAAVIKKGHIRSGGFDFEAAGRLDIVARHMDLQIRSQPVQPVVQSPAAKAIKAAELRDGDVIGLAGPWERPAIRILASRLPHP